MALRKKRLGLRSCLIPLAIAAGLAAALVASCPPAAAQLWGDRYQDQRNYQP